MTDQFGFSVRERLKEVLRQYELRERHFECVIRSKELEVLLSRARAAEQKQLADGEKARAEKAEDEVRQIAHVIYPLRCCLHQSTLLQAQHLRQDLETVQNGQTALIDKLIACCKEVRVEFSRSASSCLTDVSFKPNAERTQRLFASLREELERRGTKLADGPVGG